MSIIDKLLDENCNDNIILYTENNEQVEFEQIALIPLNGRVYAMLRPLNCPDIAEDEALVFEVILDDEPYLEICEDDETVDVVFKEYYEMLDEADDGE